MDHIFGLRISDYGRPSGSPYEPDREAGNTWEQLGSPVVEPSKVSRFLEGFGTSSWFSEVLGGPNASHGLWKTKT